MAASTESAPVPAVPAQAPAPAAQRLLARLALVAFAAAAALPVVSAGWRGVTLVLVVVGHLLVIAVGLWLALAHRGPVRLFGAALAVAAQLVAFTLEIRAGLLWTVVGAAALLALGARAAAAALRYGAGPRPPPERAAPPPRRPFLIMNPKSGGGKVDRYRLRERAEALGAEVVLLSGGPGTADVPGLARAAVERGADLLGVAGGDGTQALVAGVAADHDVPLLVIAAGTRNHFAIDLGLDPHDPRRCLAALHDGVELRVDLGDAAGRPFVNNVSFGAYAEIVQRPEYRTAKVHTALDRLPELLIGHRGARLTARADAAVVDGPQALLVSNNPYAAGDIAGLGRRPRLDSGRLGVVGVRARNALDAARLLRGRKAAGLQLLVAEEVVVDADRDRIAAGVDGEAVYLRTPVRCRIRPAALRVLVPRHRPGPPPVRPAVRLSTLLRLAAPHRRSAGGAR